MRHKPLPFRKDSPRDPERDGGDESLKEAPPPTSAETQTGQKWILSGALR